MSKISKTSIDWKRLEKLVPPEQHTQFFAFKAKNYAYWRRVLSNPPEAPKIDWDEYKKLVPIPGLVDQLRNKYTAFKVPYPEDKYSVEVDKQWAALEPEIQKFCNEMQNNIKAAQKELAEIAALPKFDNMTIEMFYEMFPRDALDFVNKPTFWPHTADEQLGYKDPTTKVEH